MSYAERWAALVAQIRGLQSAGELYSRFQGYHQEDSYGAGEFLRQQCRAVIRSLELFREEFASSLPPDAVSRICDFLKTNLARAANDPSAAQRGARGPLVALVGLEAEITFILSGRQEHIRARSERALRRNEGLDSAVAAPGPVAGSAPHRPTDVHVELRRKPVDGHRDRDSGPERHLRPGVV